MIKNQEKLPPKSREVIDRYLSLPVGAKPSCPYFNNRRRKSKGGLRVLKGKGTPEEIAEEVEICAKLRRVKIPELSTDKLKEFLVAEDLGVDCSGFAFHVLNAYCQETVGKNLTSFVRSMRTGMIGSLLARLRPAENIGVSSFRSDSNSFEIKISEAGPGDIITFIGTGKDKTYNHIVVITGIEREGVNTRITYAHSYAWPADGVYGHGVREGDILVHGEDLLSGTWKEHGEIGDRNFTYESAKGAKEVSVRRIKILR